MRRVPKPPPTHTNGLGPAPPDETGSSFGGCKWIFDQEHQNARFFFFSHFQSQQQGQGQFLGQLDLKESESGLHLGHTTPGNFDFKGCNYFDQ